jgi:hypothetical protein
LGTLKGPPVNVTVGLPGDTVPLEGVVAACVYVAVASTKIKTTNNAQNATNRALYV